MLVACKACGKEIGKGVKKCVQCGTDQRNFFARHKIITGLLVFVLLIAVGSALGGDDAPEVASTTAPIAAESDPETEGSPESANATPPAPRKGEAYSTGKFEITITAVEIKDSVGVEFVNSSPAEGGEYVAIQWKYKNISDEPVGMFSTPTLHLLNPAGTKFSADIGASSSYATEVDRTAKIVSDLNPGISVDDAQVFEVERGTFDSSTWTLLVDADEDVTFSLE